jgi:hypothetical protein
MSSRTTGIDRRATGEVNRRARFDRDRHRARRRVRLAVTVATTVLTITVGVSLTRALTAPGGDPVGVKLVEWVRGHGGGGIATVLENWWYTHHAPHVGGRPRRGIPHAARPDARPNAPVVTAPTTVPVEHPTAVPPLASPALPGEGAWQPTGKLVDGRPAVYETFLRPDAIHTGYLAGLVWMDTRLLRATLYNGMQVPGGGPWLRGAHVDPSDYPSLVAAFNGAFRLGDSRGGYYTEGRIVQPLVDGRASLVITRDGTATVGAWGRDVTMSSDVASVRQNVDLVVDGGQPAPGLLANDNARWGHTVGGKVFVWRSGVGVDRSGNLVYAAGPAMSIESLARVLADAGCVRAMELDINSEWVSFYTYAGTTPFDIRGIKLLGSIQRPNDRYLRDGTRDFVTLTAR